MEVPQDIITYFRDRYPYIIEEDVDAVLSLVSFRRFEPGDCFVRLGEVNAHVFFVIRGLFKAYYFDENDNEVIINFYPENALTGNWHSTLLNEASKLCIEALEPTLIVQTSLSEVDELVKDSARLLRAYNDILKRKLIASLENIWENMNEKPETRYLKLQREKPDLLHRLTQKDIASYLGVTPVSLSRIKKRLMTRDIT